MKQPSQKDIPTLLKQEAQRNIVFSAVCHSFAERERTRYQVTLHTLTYNMKKEGFNFTKEEYANCLKFLAGLGIGTLTYNRSKRVTGLVGIQITLQSIGKAATSGTPVRRQEPVHRFKELSASEELHAKEFVEAGPKSTPPVKTGLRAPVRGVRAPQPYPAFLTVLIEGKPVNFAGPADLTPDTLTDFLVGFRKIINKEGKDL